ncbi:MAG: hypothetical protein U1F30_16690 [Steroidobacteraceae bacterium]
MHSRELWRVNLERNRREPLAPPDEAAAYPYEPADRALIAALRERALVGTAAQVANCARSPRASRSTRS